jgi:hypothetical protein
MRFKVIVPVLALGLLILGGLLALRSGRAQLDEQPITSAQPTLTNAAETLVRSTDGELIAPPLNANPTATETSPVAEISPAVNHEKYVFRRVAELQDLSAENDTNSLATILSELTNRDPEIRKAALNASIQFGSRDAIPVLLDVASQTADEAEKAELIEAADYLKLPSLTEVLARRKGSLTAPKLPTQTSRYNLPSKKTAPAPPPP